MVSAASAMPATVTTLPSLSSSPPPASSSSQTAMLNQNQFLQLMTAQLQYQDPLNPMTGAEFASELAEFSTATGVQNLQTGLTTLTTSVNTVQATDLVGHSVATSGNTLVLNAGGGAPGAVNLSAAASDVTISITDASGNPVDTVDLGPMSAGLQTFVWNGIGANGSPLPPGTYKFTVNAVGSNGAAVTAAPYTVAQVTAVSLGGTSGPMLDLTGGLAPVALSSVQQVF